MSRWKRIIEPLKRIYFSETEKSGGPVQKLLVYLVRYIFHIFREMARDQCWLRASALTFTTLMTLIPVVVLIFVTFRAFGGLDDATTRVQSFLFQHMLPDSVASIQGFIEGMVSDFNAQAVSYVSLIFLIAAAYSLFASVDSSLNVIWGGQKSRRFMNQLVNIWFILTIAPILMGFSLYLTTQLENVTMLGLGAFAAKALTRLMPYLLTLIAFTLLYKLVPRQKVAWGSALLGSFFAALFWEISKYAFNFYVQNLSNYKLLYGSFLILPVFLIWVNLSWLILLTGAEIAYTHQNLDLLHLINRRNERARSNLFLLSERLGVYIFFFVVERFISGKPLDRADLNLISPGAGWMVDTYLKRFQDKGLILMNQDDMIVPAKDPSAIFVNDVFDFIDPVETDDLWDDTSDKVRSAELVLKELSLLRRKAFTDRDVRRIVKESLESEVLSEQG